MSPLEMMSEIQKYIDESFAEGKELDEVLAGIRLYVETLQS